MDNFMAGMVRGNRLLDTKGQGLTSSAASQKRNHHGPNLMPVEKRASPWLQWLRQMTHFFAVMLWTAGVHAILANMLELGIAIFIIIFINGT
jgi:magnesium-transporting ATPase (P-type)